MPMPSRNRLILAKIYGTLVAVSGEGVTAGPGPAPANSLKYGADDAFTMGYITASLIACPLIVSLSFTFILSV
ncbi:hypothetical protein B0T21DRAFT_366676 [Apiosordaria backusii]|uniref:Uncharacterized protein n=1 Tax=Apiosordaria backusii TaxID=314023 RepID=A0AA40BL82_9PEZI|nr:hypothetical protein B0T21DRAFT_366676 [Apiosordaria backusii]